MLVSLLQALPPKEKKQLPVATSVRKKVKLKGLPPATVIRFSLSNQAVTRLMKEFDSDGSAKRYYNLKTTDAPWNSWGAPKGPITLSLIIVPAADATDSDWIGLGLDEKQLLQALLQATHPVPGQTLAARSDLTPYTGQNPTSLGFHAFEAQSRLIALLGGPDAGPALAVLQNLFHGTSVVSTTQIKIRGNVAEAGFSYYLSKEGLAAVRQILSLDIEQILEMANTASEKASVKSGGASAKP